MATAKEKRRFWPPLNEEMIKRATITYIETPRKGGVVQRETLQQE